jgi:translation initiation factor 2 subunit 2
MADNVDELSFDPSAHKKPHKHNINDSSDLEIGVDENYIHLLKRVYTLIGSDSYTKKSIEPIKIGKIGTKRTVWCNFGHNCHQINRDIKHVAAFIFIELSTTGSINDQNMLIVVGRFKSEQFENVLKKYITEFITCNACKQPNTELIKKNRITFKVCKDCHCQRSVTNID